MRVVITHMRLRAALEGRQVRDLAVLPGATDMPRSFLLIALLFLLSSPQIVLAAEGRALYEATCIACHGPKAQGAIPGVPDLAKGGRLTKPDAVLAANILNGFQSKGSPMAMPAKGGNPDLTAADVQALLTYMRALTGTSPARPASVTPKRAPASATAIVAAPSPAPARAPALAPAPAPAPTPAPTPAPAPAAAAPITAVAPSPARAPAPAAALAPAAATAATAAAAPSPQPATTPAPQPEMAAFARGAKAWANNCARCHGMRDPKEQTDQQWKVVMTHMRLRAGLDEQQVRDITLFLQGSN